MRSFVPSQPEDSCEPVAHQRVLILQMLTMELLSRSLLVRFAPNSLINGFPHFRSAPKPRACLLSLGITRHTLLTPAVRHSRGITTDWSFSVCLLYLFMREGLGVAALRPYLTTTLSPHDANTGTCLKCSAHQKETTLAVTLVGLFVV